MADATPEGIVEERGRKLSFRENEDGGTLFRQSFSDGQGNKEVVPFFRTVGKGERIKQGRKE